jgi:hypothetical protein
MFYYLFVIKLLLNFEKIIQMTQPDIVMVELCQSRVRFIIKIIYFNQIILGKYSFIR